VCFLHQRHNHDFGAHFGSDRATLIDNALVGFLPSKIDARIRQDASIRARLILVENRRNLHIFLHAFSLPLDKVFKIGGLRVSMKDSKSAVSPVW
jgi:hypothetical protein